MTTHPRHGLAEIIRLWSEGIHPHLPGARLHIYSASLHRAMIAETPGDAPEDAPEDAEEPVFKAIRAAAADGVEIKAPLGDTQMAEIYAEARVHLYPPIASEMYGSTLAESQARGLPAVVGPMDGAKAPALGERVLDGRTGYLAPDAAAFVNLARQLLGDDRVHAGMSRDARTLQGRRGWDLAAIEFETLWARGI